MNNKYTDLFEEYTFNNGETINTRFALAVTLGVILHLF